jgi:hypothetical protein
MPGKMNALIFVRGGTMIIRCAPFPLARPPRNFNHESGAESRSRFPPAKAAAWGHRASGFPSRPGSPSRALEPPFTGGLQESASGSYPSAPPDRPEGNASP